MKDDLQRRGAVNLNEKSERRYWCEKFGVTEVQLGEAVRQVGKSADKVEAYLNKNR